ncbi:hypothetical protein AYI68_g5641 [Smittium mucronatum]|uniref:Uncharacterized protein n=1 Tax=Smittium mucronatum TaxID=133383 RepID=A0A1R0GTU6_9FUNG|nr:hypothetical protein AYI68_g5641 [Smittium mucronatum]
MPQPLSAKLIPGNFTFLEYGFRIRSGPGRRGLSVSIQFNDENASKWEMAPFNKTIDILDDGALRRFQFSIASFFFYSLVGIFATTLVLSLLFAEKKTKQTPSIKMKMK